MTHGAAAVTVAPARGRRGAAAALVRRHPYLTIFLVALAARCAIAVVVYVRYGGSLFLDDAAYSDLAAQKAEGDTANWDAYTHFLYDRTATMLWPMTWLYEVFGPLRIVGQVFVALFGAGTAVVAARLARLATGLRGALLVGFGIALMPSQVIFSATTMKDALVWFLLAGLALLVALGMRATGTCLVWLGGAVLVTLVLLGYLRVHTQMVAVTALVLTALLVRPAAGRLVVAAGVLAIGLTAPWLAGSGPAGLQLVAPSVDAQYLSGLREAQAIGGSALDVEPDVPEPAPGGAAPGGRPGTGGSSSGPSQVATPAPVDAPAEAAPPAVVEREGAATLSYLPRGLFAVLLGPAPWDLQGSGAFRAAAVENVLWFCLLGLAVLGAPLAWPHRRIATFPLLVGGGCLVMWALVEGNAGTAFRHRGEFVWAGWVLASFGVAAITSRRTALPLQDTAQPGESFDEVPRPARPTSLATRAPR